MVRLLSKYRRTAALTIALLVSFVLMTLQIRQPWDLLLPLKQALWTSISPTIKLTHFTTTTASRIWQDYLNLRGVRKENLRLKEEISALRERSDALQEAELEGGRLRRLLELKEETGLPLKAARVIGMDVTNWFRTLFIDKGFKDGIIRNMPVMSPDGVVGRVVEVMPHASKVQLVNDPNSSISAILQKDRFIGLIIGDLMGKGRMRYLPMTAEIEVGEKVITSGHGGVFPKGVPIGRIEQLERKGGSFFQEAKVAFSVDFTRLEEVLILTRTPSPLIQGIE